MFKNVLVAAAFAVAFSGGVAAQSPDRAISKIGGDVYRFQNKFHYNIFVVTGDGVVVTDPINAEAAGWLRAEIAKITDQPITHLIYSHSHGDHASGGAAYGDVPNVIAHANAPDTIDGVAPTKRFDSEHSFALGSKNFELTYLGPGHGTDLIAVVVRPENVGFIVDAVSAKRLPYRDFPGSNVDDWANQVRKAETLQFDVFAPGHGSMGTKADVTDGRVYLEELRAEVLAALKSGKSDDEVAATVMMDKYSDWGSYKNWRELNVRGMARFLRESGALN
jgi:glyoxylase-like metal-dependent hydrolase (beta-lactamase superfamily II)